MLRALHLQDLYIRNHSRLLRLLLYRDTHARTRMRAGNHFVVTDHGARVRVSCMKRRPDVTRHDSSMVFQKCNTYKSTIPPLTLSPPHSHSYPRPRADPTTTRSACGNPVDEWRFMHSFSTSAGPVSPIGRGSVYINPLSDRAQFLHINLDSWHTGVVVSF